MTNVCHLFGKDVGWEQRIGVSQLMDRLPSDRFDQSLSAPQAVLRTTLSTLASQAIDHPTAGRWPAAAGPTIAKLLDRQQADIIHAWGVAAALPARAATGKPMVIELHDPALSDREIKQIRSIASPQHFALSCLSQTVRRRLIEGGVAPELCVVIRPGINFAEINRTRRKTLRRSMGIAHDDHVIVFPEPVTPRGNYVRVFLSLMMLKHASREIPLRLVLPGSTSETERIRRLARVSPIPDNMLCIADGRPFEEVLAVADTMIMAPDDNVATTAIAWAMATRVLVIASAVRATAELIANNLNGFLFKPTPRAYVAPTIARLVTRHLESEKTKEVAHGQAFEVFSLRRYVDQHARLYGNVLAGGAPGEGIVDPAMTNC